ncbi:MAG: HAD family phosphatase [Candidatus Heimdallarchaeota archaeon]|nr:HAD family phosphatase [Candidatus Heimdallarchaeota archaeon]MCK5047922.1 HAD family phosphatase [Candidatus Heimdallarchaeota archaeon]
MTYQAIFFDVDGTLTTNTVSWVLVHKEMGTEAEMKELTRAYFKGEIDYFEWSRLDAELWIGESEEKLVKAFGEIEKTIRPGTKEVFEILKQNNIATFLISGGVSHYIYEIQHLIGASYAIANDLEIKDNLLTGGITVNVSDYKGEVILELAKEHDLDLTKCAALGDAFNDVDMFEKVKTSLAICSSDERLNGMATYVSHSPDLREAFLKLYPEGTQIGNELKQSLTNDKSR